VLVTCRYEYAPIMTPGSTTRRSRPQTPLPLMVELPSSERSRPNYPQRSCTARCQGCPGESSRTLDTYRLDRRNPLARSRFAGGQSRRSNETIVLTTKSGAGPQSCLASPRVRSSTLATISMGWSHWSRRMEVDCPVRLGDRSRQSECPAEVSSDGCLRRAASEAGTAHRRRIGVSPSWFTVQPHRCRVPWMT